MADRQAFEEEPFEGEFPFEEDFEVFGPDEDLEALFESEGDLDPLGFEAEEGELSDAKVRRAVRLNPRWARRLRWQARRDDIVRLLGFTDMSPDEATFAQAIARWQGSRRLTADGIIGPNTWRRMRAQLGVRLSAAAVRRAVRLNPRWARRLGWQARRDDIVRLLGFTDMSPDEATFAQAVARWQGRRLTADGIIGPNTWRRMRAQLGRLPTPPVRPGVQLIRKDQAEMKSRAEQERFKTAYIALIRSGFMTSHVAIHSNAGPPPGHNMHGTFTGPIAYQRFLPWHRLYLHRLEEALRRVDRNVSIPYWKWTADRDIPSWLATFRPSGILPEPDGIKRSTGRLVRNLPRREEIASIMRESVFTTFVTRLEGAHNQVHRWVGGTMASGATAPADPIFWLHHAEIDRLWHLWQRNNPGKNPTLAGDDARLDPWPERVDQVLDIGVLGYDYA